MVGLVTIRDEREKKRTGNFMAERVSVFKRNNFVFYLHFVKDSRIKTQALGKDQIKVWLHYVSP